MREALTFLYSRLFVESMLVIGIVATVIGRLRRRLRITPDQATRAPLFWLVSLTADARLHRRLRRLAARARAAARGGIRHRSRHGRTPTQRLAADIEGVLIDLDERLVASTKFDFDAQRDVVRAIRADAGRIDTLIDRVTALINREANDLSSTIAADPIGDLNARVDHLEQLASRDADRVIDASAGSPVAGAIEATAEVLESPT